MTDVFVKFLPGFPLGLLFGLLNLFFLSKIITNLMGSETVSPGKTFVYFILKILLIFSTLGLLLWKRVVTPVPFLTGYTLSLVSGLAYFHFKKR